MRTDKILARAEFDSRLPKYFLLQSSFGILCTFILIPLLPFWILWIGRKIHQKQYENLSAALTERSLNVNKGFLFKTQKNIPLDKITDLAVNEGPILRYLGLCSLQIETAGGGQGNTMGHATLPGVVDALEFRDAVLEQRDLVSGAGPIPAAVTPGVAAVGDANPDAASPQAAANVELLTEIRDTLREIERHVATR